MVGVKRKNLGRRLRIKSETENGLDIDLIDA